MRLLRGCRRERSGSSSRRGRRRLGYATELSIGALSREDNSKGAGAADEAAAVETGTGAAARERGRKRLGYATGLSIRALSLDDNSKGAAAAERGESEETCHWHMYVCTLGRTTT